MKEIFQILGLDNVSGPWYAFWSGFGGDLTIFAGLFAIAGSFLRKHNCHVKGCWRIGRHPVDGTQYVVCRRHHPDDSPTHKDVISRWRKN